MLPFTGLAIFSQFMKEKEILDFEMLANGLYVTIFPSSQLALLNINLGCTSKFLPIRKKIEN